MTSGPGFLLAGRYRLLSRIGGGGMGAVWLARDELLGRQVAVKQVLPPPGADPGVVDQQRQRALREGRIAARLSHPHAISVYDVAVEAGSPWLVMEFLPSRSLAEVLQEDGVLRVDQVAQIGAQVADALVATHEAGIVHRDVKPGNILVGQGARVEGLVKITDFGISHASGDVTLTQTGLITGTPAFLAPEVAQGAEMSPASDVFSLGATLYTCLEGEPPFGMDDNALRLLHRVARGEATPPRRAGALTGPLTRMLVADPAQRPGMRQVRDELVTLAAGRDGDRTTVLLARTDLRAAPGPTGTAELAAGAGAAPAAIPGGGTSGDGTPGGGTPRGGTPRSGSTGGGTAPGTAGGGAAADGVGAAPAARSGTAVGNRPASPAPARRTPTVTARPRRGRSLLIAAVVAAALLVGLGVAWLAAGDGGAGTAAGPTTPSAPASEEPDTSASEPAQATEDAATSPPADPAAVRAQEVRDALRDYHALLPGDPAAAWERTGPTLRSVTTYPAYQQFWAQFADVRIGDLETEDGSLVATGELEFRYPDGSRQRELHRFTLVPGADGRLLLDSDEFLQQLGSD